MTAPSASSTRHGVRPMTLADYDAVMDLMRQTPGISLRDADAFDATARYLERNPGLSFVCERDGRLAGCVMCGHDGRRGYLQHLLVLPAYRRQGIGGMLVASCLERLASLGILKCHIDVLRTNASAMTYWAGQGWQRRDDIWRYSFVDADNPNA